MAPRKTAQTRVVEREYDQVDDAHQIDIEEYQGADEFSSPIVGNRHPSDDEQPMIEDEAPSFSEPAGQRNIIETDFAHSDDSVIASDEAEAIEEAQIEAETAEDVIDNPTAETVAEVAAEVAHADDENGDEIAEEFTFEAYETHLTENEREVAAQAKGKLSPLKPDELYNINPYDLHVKPGWNCRDMNSARFKNGIRLLAEQIAEDGVLVSIRVWDEKGKLYVSDGHRRLMATLYAIRYLGKPIMAVKTERGQKFEKEADRKAHQLSMNSSQHLTPLEQARNISDLIEKYKWPISLIAKKAGFSQSHVHHVLKLLELPDEVQQLISDDVIRSNFALELWEDCGKDADLMLQRVEEGKQNALEKAQERAEKTGKPTEIEAVKVTKKHMNEPVGRVSGNNVRSGGVLRTPPRPSLSSAGRGTRQPDPIVDERLKHGEEQAKVIGHVLDKSRVFDHNKSDFQGYDTTSEVMVVMPRDVWAALNNAVKRKFSLPEPTLIKSIEVSRHGGSANKKAEEISEEDAEA